jgi:hypothetical protein
MAFEPEAYMLASGTAEQAFFTDLSECENKSANDH